MEARRQLETKFLSYYVYTNRTETKRHRLV